MIVGESYQSIASPQAVLPAPQTKEIPDLYFAIALIAEFGLIGTGVAFMGNENITIAMPAAAVSIGSLLCFVVTIFKLFEKELRR